MDGLEEARKGAIKKADEYDEANHPIRASIQNGFFNVAAGTGINLLDDMLQEVTWGLKGQQSWGDVGIGIVSTFYKTTAPTGVPLVGLAPGTASPPAPAMALTLEGGSVVVAAPAMPMLINPSTILVMANASQPASSTPALKKGGKGPNDVGTQTEQQAGADPRAGRSTYRGPVTGKPRISDINNPTTLGEIKGNFNYVQWLSSQIKDGLARALQTGQEYLLKLARPDKVTKPLQKAIEEHNSNGGNARITGASGH